MQGSIIYKSVVSGDLEVIDCRFDLFYRHVVRYIFSLSNRTSNQQTIKEDKTHEEDRNYG